MSIWNIESRRRAVDEVLERAPALPVLVIENPAQAVPLARTLLEAGLPVLEVTLRSDGALEAIARMAREVPEAVVGAGTILEPADLAAVEQAGARFAISPGATAELYRAAENCAIPWIPGVATATDIMTGLASGHRRFKFFPARALGGVETLKAWRGPFPQVRFCPTGGIDATSAREYLELPNVITVGGSWMVPPEALAAGDWPAIAEHARSAARA